MAEPRERRRVVIVGAGFAGFNAVRELSRLVGARTEIVVINSFFTTCNGVCPVMSSTLQKIQDAAGDRLGRDVVLISISVDPAHDTPAKMRAYAKRMSAKRGWYFLSGEGEMWRKQGDREEVVRVGYGVCLTIPLGTHFQFRTVGVEALVAVVVTMPPWPGEDDAFVVEAIWISELTDSLPLEK